MAASRNHGHLEGAFANTAGNWDALQLQIIFISVALIVPHRGARLISQASLLLGDGFPFPVQLPSLLHITPIVDEHTRIPKAAPAGLFVVFADVACEVGRGGDAHVGCRTTWALRGRLIVPIYSLCRIIRF